MTARVFAPSLPDTAPETSASGVTVDIGDLPIFLESNDGEFCGMAAERYAGFMNPQIEPVHRLSVDVCSSVESSEEDARVWKDGRVWRLERGDFRAVWNPELCQGHVRQSRNPYSLDTLLRLVHSLVLVEEGGFLLHAASAVRFGRAFLFTGISGAGKTTIARLAPPDADVLTDEISYVRPRAEGYRAYGTPFAGELARVGTNTSAPVARLFLLEKGPENRIEPVEKLAAARALLRNILFFAHEGELVQRVFDTALAFVSRVRVERLTFVPDRRVWEGIR